MDKSWMNLSRISPQYHDGVESFLSFAFEKSSIHGMILCPCIECGNGVMRTKVDVREHLIVKGFIKGYTYWVAHGELTCPQSTVNNSECSSSTHHAPDDMHRILKSIIELDYRGGRRVVMFECDWVSTGGRLKKDENGFTLVNFANIRPHDEPYILASQASQVFYVEDPTEKDWKVVITTSSRSAYKMYSAHDVDTYLQGGIDDPTSNDGDEGFSVVREGVRGVEINVEET